MSDKKRKVKAVQCVHFSQKDTHLIVQEDGSKRRTIDYTLEKYLLEDWEILTPPTFSGEGCYLECNVIFVKYED